MDVESIGQTPVLPGFPVSDHCDGTRFFNPAGRGGRSLADVLRWKMRSRPAEWPTWVDDPPQSPPPVPSAGELVVTFVNHATFLIRTPGLTVLTDPVFATRASPFSWAGPRRIRHPGVRFDALPPIDLVLISHNHYDHMDLEALAALAQRDQPQVITPLGNAGLLASAGLTRVIELDWWDTTMAAGTDDVEVVLAPAQHFSARGLRDLNRALWGSFLLRWADRRVYFAADSGYASHFREVRRHYGPVDLALIPIGAYEPRWLMRDAHMNPAEAVAAHRDLASRFSIGMHFGTFQLTDEAIDAPARALAIARAAAGIPDEEFRVPDAGESFTLR